MLRVTWGLAYATWKYSVFCSCIRQPKNIPPHHFHCAPETFIYLGSVEVIGKRGWAVSLKLFIKFGVTFGWRVHKWPQSAVHRLKRSSLACPHLMASVVLVSPLTLKNRFNSSQSEQNRISSDTNACEGLWENLEHSARISWESDLKPMSCDTNRRRFLHDLIGSSAYIYNVNPQSRSTFRCATFWTKHSSFTPFVFF